MLESNQIYSLNQLKTRKAKVILAAIKRECGGPVATTPKIIKDRISRELHAFYHVRTLEQIPQQNYEQCKQLIMNYKFRFLGKDYG